jgi:hypothetical protein
MGALLGLLISVTGDVVFLQDRRGTTAVTVALGPALAQSGVTLLARQTTAGASRLFRRDPTAIS